MIDARTYIEANLDRYVAELTEFASIPSVSSQATGIDEAARWVQAALARRGVDARILPTAGNPVVVGKTGAGTRTVLLYNHYDVQPPEPIDAWTTPPFQPTLRDGKLYARGVMDDKGEVVARLAAFDVLRERYGNDLPLRLTFLIEGEEESGSVNLEPFIAEHKEMLAADACIWEAGQVDNAGRPLVWLGVRGLISIELVARTMKHDAHSGWAHALPNAAWRLVEALSTLRDADGNITIDGFSDDVTGATARQRELLAAMPDEIPTYRAEYDVERFVGGREGLALREAVFTPTCNITGIWAGHIEKGHKTVIPATAHARIDFRLAPDQDPQHALACVSAHLRRRGFDDIELIPTERGQRAACSDPDHPFVELTIDVLRERYNTEPVVSPMVGGTGPAAYFVHHLGVPFASIGCSYPGSRKHAPDENVRLTDFVRGASAIADLLDRYATYASPSSMIASR
jgi:acetylornithine deacetylase/succinyl-diaminopimelate desuccinylase-like protein